MQYYYYRNNQINKITNAIVYLAQCLPNIPHTKLLMLLYILEEQSVVRYGLPFLGLRYKLWACGPVAEPIHLTLLGEVETYSEKISIKDGKVSTTATFSDDEFSDNEIQMMDELIKAYGNQSLQQLSDYVRREQSSWYALAEQKKLLYLFQTRQIIATNYYIDFSTLLTDDPIKKGTYNHHLKSFALYS